MTRRGNSAVWRRLDLLRDLRAQLPNLSGPTRTRTARAIRQLEHEIARGPGREAEALRQLDLGAER